MWPAASVETPTRHVIEVVIGQFYVATVIGFGGVLLGIFFPTRTFESPGLFLTLLALSSITSVFKVNLPLARSGSTYRKPGAVVLVREDGLPGLALAVEAAESHDLALAGAGVAHPQHDLAEVGQRGRDDDLPAGIGEMDRVAN